ncbi:muscarinic acetylcholine receptor M3-like [Glandiceps talaboti]
MAVIDAITSPEMLTESYNVSDEPPTEFELPESIYSLPVKIVLLSSAVVITVVAIIGNSLILAAFFTTARLRRLTNYFYASLAITDLAAGIIVMPFMASYTLLYYWRFGKDFCVFWLCMDMFVYSASVYHMCVICLDRFLAITFPFKYRLKRTRKLILGFVAGAWILALIFEVPATLIYEHVAGESVVDYRIECDVEWVEDVPITFISFFVTVVIPFLFTLILYVHIFVTIRRSHRYLVPDQDKNTKKSTNKGKVGREKCPIQFNCAHVVPCFLCLKSERDGSSQKKGNACDIEVKVHGCNDGVDKIGFDRSASGRMKQLCCCCGGQKGYDITNVIADGTNDNRRESVMMVGFAQKVGARLASVDDNELSDHYSPPVKSLKKDEKVYNTEDLIDTSDKCKVTGATARDLADPNDNTRQDNLYKQCYVNPILSVDSESPKKVYSNTSKDELRRSSDSNERTDRTSDSKSTDIENVTPKSMNETSKFGSGKKGGMKRVSASLINVLRIKAAAATSSQNQRQSQEAILARRKAKETRAAATLGILLGIFLLTWLPWKVTTIADAIAQKYLFPDLWYEIAIWLQYSNSMINPFLYMFREKDFRIAIKRLLCKLICRRKVDEDSRMSRYRTTQSRRSVVSNNAYNTSES